MNLFLISNYNNNIIIKEVDLMWSNNFSTLYSCLYVGSQYRRTATTTTASNNENEEKKKKCPQNACSQLPYKIYSACVSCKFHFSVDWVLLRKFSFDLFKRSFPLICIRNEYFLCVCFFCVLNFLFFLVISISVSFCAACCAGLAWLLGCCNNFHWYSLRNDITHEQQKNESSVLVFVKYFL